MVAQVFLNVGTLGDINHKFPDLHLCDILLRKLMDLRNKRLGL